MDAPILSFHRRPGKGPINYFGTFLVVGATFGIIVCKSQSFSLKA
jgi:hypothetical protein